MGQFVALLGTAGTAAAATAATTATVGAAATATAATATGGFLGLSAGAWQGLGTLGSMVTGIASGNAQKKNYQMQAKKEEFAATDREISRRKRLLASLASQNAARAAGGVAAFEGSPAAMMNADKRAYSYDQLIGDANAEMVTSSLLASGDYAQQSGYMSAGSSLLDFGTSMAKRG